MDRNMASKTSVEVAEAVGNTTAFDLLSERVLSEQQKQQYLQQLQELQDAMQLQQQQQQEQQQQQQQQIQELQKVLQQEQGQTEEQRAIEESERKEEAEKRIEMHNIDSEECKDVMANVAEKSEGEIRQMMIDRDIPINMWSDIWSRYSALQKAIPDLQKEQVDKSAQLANIKEQISELQQKEKDLEQRLVEVEETLQIAIVPTEVLDVLESLANVEQSALTQLNAQLKEDKENALLSLDDIALFFNAAGMAHNSKKLTELARAEDITEMSLDDAYQFIRLNITLENRLETQFAIDMVKHSKFPPFNDHHKECPVCKNSVPDLLEEYGIRFEESALVKLHPFSLIFLEHFDVTKYLETKTNAERIRTMKAIQTMRQNHTNFITKQ